MGEGDFMPSGGHRKKPIDPKRLKEIRAKMAKAGEIHKRAIEHHKGHDVPKAEEDLLKDLKNVPNNKPKTNS